MKSLLRYDLEVFKIPVDDEDVGDMSREEFSERFQEAEPIDSDMYFFYKIKTKNKKKKKKKKLK